MSSQPQRGRSRFLVTAASTVALSMVAVLFMTRPALAAPPPSPQPPPPPAAGGLLLPGPPPAAAAAPAAKPAPKPGPKPAAKPGPKPAAKPGPKPKAAAKPAGGDLEGTPCSASARACVELDSHQAWLVKDGKVVRGPVSISSGGNGEETPTGTFHVLSKDKDHKSQEFKIKSGPKKGQPAPMPWSVFFAPGGVAFHSGDPDRDSAGCIHLEPGDAQAWFSSLQVGDEVQVFQNSDGDDNDNGDGDDKSGDDDDDHGGDDDDHGGDDDHGDDD